MKRNSSHNSFLFIRNYHKNLHSVNGDYEILTFFVQTGNTFSTFLNAVKFTEELRFSLIFCSDISTYFMVVVFGLCSITMINVGSFALMRWFSLLVDRP
jgi:hypothetical protein